jgi:exonuclease VII large subunit
MDKRANKMLLINELLEKIRKLLLEDDQVTNVLIDMKIRDLKSSSSGYLYFDISKL